MWETNEPIFDISAQKFITAILRMAMLMDRDIELLTIYEA
jgi:hypothetical protein